MHWGNVENLLTDGRILADRLINTNGAPRVLMALLRSGPTYVKSLTYDTRMVDKTVRKAISILVEMKLVQIHPAPDTKHPHAKEYYALTPNGKDIALALIECHEVMISHMSRIVKQSKLKQE